MQAAQSPKGVAGRSGTQAEAGGQATELVSAPGVLRPDSLVVELGRSQLAVNRGVYWEEGAGGHGGCVGWEHSGARTANIRRAGHKQLWPSCCLWHLRTAQQRAPGLHSQAAHRLQSLTTVPEDGSPVAEGSSQSAAASLLRPAAANTCMP